MEFESAALLHPMEIYLWICWFVRFEHGEADDEHGHGSIFSTGKVLLL